jgi:hypothetical protein
MGTVARGKAEKGAVRPSSRRFRRAVVVVTLMSTMAGCGIGRREQQSGDRPVAPTASAASTGPVVADVDEVLGGDGPLFGVTLSDRSAAAVAKVAAKVGCRPALQQVFASVEDGISAKTLRAVAGIPVLSLEPWTSGEGPDQPEWSLSETIGGHWDRQYETVARSVVEYRSPVLIRFAHEMNGFWYPWGTTNGNEPGQFVAAWKHVVDLFRAAGATNALWVWSPNILRGADSRTLKPFWPGKAYVDVVGLTGYGVRETSPVTTYRATLKLVYALTDKPILLTEVGVQPGVEKRAWLRAFGGWLRDNPKIAGFLWNQITRDGDWRYDDNSGNLAAFKSSLKTAKVRC